MIQGTRPPVTDTIVVESRDLFGVTATVNGRRQHFPNLDALFRAAVQLVERNPGHNRDHETLR